MAKDSNTKGVLHELVTGYYLKGSHLNLEEYNRLTTGLTLSEIELAHRYGRVAADSLLERFGGIQDVHWTSKAGDIERLTGIPTTQHDDPSDLVLTFGVTPHYLGVSLKVSDSTSNVPISNPGMEATCGGQIILDLHREKVYDLFPVLKTASNKAGRKELVRADPKMAATIKQMNKVVLKDIIQGLHSKLVTMPTEEAANHIRKYVLHARSTPLQDRGHLHLRHTTYGKKNTRIKMIDPATEYENFLRDHWKLGFSYNGGNSVNFLSDGVPFAQHRMKFESQSDPMSSVKGSGTDIPPKKTKYKQ